MKKGPVLVFISYVTWGLLPIFWKLLADVDPIYTLCCRIVFSLLLSIVVVLLTGKWKKAIEIVRDRKKMLAMLACGLLISFNWGTLIYCVSANRVLDVSLAYYINPILAILLGFVVFKEKLKAGQWCAVFLALVGVMVPMFMEGQFPILAVLIGLSFAIYGAVKKKAEVPGDVSMVLETMLVTPIAIVALVVMELNNGPIASGQIEGWRLLLLPTAGALTYLPLILYSTGIASTPMGLSGVLMYINPTIQLLVGLVLYKETMSTAMIITFICVWIATVVFVLSGNTKKNETEGVLEREPVEV